MIDSRSLQASDSSTTVWNDRFWQEDELNELFRPYRRPASRLPPTSPVAQ